MNLYSMLLKNVDVTLELGVWAQDSDSPVKDTVSLKIILLSQASSKQFYFVSGKKCNEHLTRLYLKFSPPNLNKTKELSSNGTEFLKLFSCSVSAISECLREYKHVSSAVSFNLFSLFWQFNMGIWEFNVSSFFFNPPFLSNCAHFFYICIISRLYFSPSPLGKVG